ncbi:MAG: SHOCT domain-containing protein, partial [SAR324 cluster bacterium]|nr:SHOCT domain-containing protein [SAR324 cluster bacterium]
MKKFLIASILLLVGCSNPGIVKVSPDTYMLFREDHAGIFGSGPSLKAGVIRDVNIFAESQGKIAIPVLQNYKPLGGGPAQWASFEY